MSTPEHKEKDEAVDRLMRMAYGTSRAVHRNVLSRAYRVVEILQAQSPISEEHLCQQLGIPFTHSDDNNRQTLRVTMRPLIAIGLITRERAIAKTEKISGSPAKYRFSFERFEREINIIRETARVVCSAEVK